MFAIVRYAGQYRKAYIYDEVERWGERFVEAFVEGFKIPKQLHFDSIQQYDYSQQAS